MPRPIRFFLLFSGFAVLLALAGGPEAVARQVDFPDYREAFEALDSGAVQVARSVANQGPDTVLNKAIRAVLMARPGNDYSFAELSAFVDENPAWPDLAGILMIAEQKIPPDASAADTVAWFNAHPPFTLAGFNRHMAALNALGQAEAVRGLVRARWVERDFSAAEMDAFRSRYAPLLTSRDHAARLDRLLWDNNAAGARAMAPFLDAGRRALAEARLAFARATRPELPQLAPPPEAPPVAAKKNKKASAKKPVRKPKNARPPGLEARLAAVPAALRRDPGLLYEMTRWHRKNDRDAAALAILERAPADPGRAESWWEERHILLRRLMEKRDYARAWKLAAHHQLASGAEYAQAEFTAGWLALRFLRRPDLAERHFRAMADDVKTPVSRARAAYWLGRALEELGDAAQARTAYETASVLSTTFYGQLAAARLYEQATLEAPPEPPVPSGIRDQFFDRDNVQAILHLERLGETRRARAFFKALLDTTTQRVDFALAMELAYQINRPDWAIQAAKAANQKNMLVGAGAFPLLSVNFPTPPDPAFTHALIRQESLFNPDALSPAGARGLMQLMPGTAREMAQKTGSSCRASDMHDPACNLALGTAFIQRQLDQFDGSLVLALAGYNAGPRRAREWMAQYGDPRRPEVDPVDWIESVPVYETRNYIQRILENLQVYRARLRGGAAPLLILEDLKR